jgi:hypothetical protein
METKKITVSLRVEDFENWNDTLDKDEPIPGEKDVIDKFTVKVTDNIEVDFKLCQGIHNPYAEAVWFDDGAEITSEIIEEIAPGMEIECEYHDVRYIVVLQEK